MDDATTDERLQMGGNFPPVQLTPEELKIDLTTRYDKTLKRADDLLAQAAKVPAEIADDQVQGDASTLIKSMRAMEISLDQTWGVEAEPFETRAAVVKGTFGNPIEKLKELRLTISKYTEAYTKRKKDQAKKKLEEEAERLRLVEKERMRLAADAETTKAAAGRAISEYEQLENEARIAKAAAHSEIEIAEADLKTAKAAAGKLRAEQLSLKAKYAGRRKDGEEIDENARSAEISAFDSQIAEADFTVVRAKQNLDDAIKVAAAARQREKDAQEEIDRQTRIQNAANRDINANFNEAARVQVRADKIEKRAEGPGLGKTYSDMGALSTLTKVWQSTVLDYDKLPKDKIWPHIRKDAIDAAVNSYMKSLAPTEEARVCPGALFEHVEVGLTR